MQARNSRPRLLCRSSVIVTLCLLIWLTSVANVHAQKTPPIFKDNESSPFNSEQIKDLRNKAIGGDTEEAKLARNRLIAITVEQVDIAFHDYRKKSRKRTDRLNFLFDFLEIGASSAISIVTGTLRAKSLIGESLSLFQGSRAAFNKDFRFLEKQILFDKMVANRSDKLTAIYAKFNMNNREYPWEQARSELRDYFFAGTMDEALSSLSRDTGAEAQTAEKALDAAKIQAGILLALTPEQLKADDDIGVGLDPIRRANDAFVKEIATANAEIAAAQTPADKATAQAKKDKAILGQTKLVDKLKAIYDAVAKEPTLMKIRDGLSTAPDLGSDQKARIADSLTKIGTNNGTYDDYFRVLSNVRLRVVNLIPTDARPNAAFQQILIANK